MVHCYMIFDPLFFLLLILQLLKDVCCVYILGTEEESCLQYALWQVANNRRMWNISNMGAC